MHLCVLLSIVKLDKIYTFRKLYTMKKGIWDNRLFSLAFPMNKAGGFIPPALNHINSKLFLALFSNGSLDKITEKRMWSVGP